MKKVVGEKLGTQQKVAGRMERLRQGFGYQFTLGVVGLTLVGLLHSGTKLVGLAFGLGSDIGVFLAMWLLLGMATGIYIQKRIDQRFGWKNAEGVYLLLCGLSVVLGAEVSSVTSVRLGDSAVAVLPVLLGGLPGVCLGAA